MLYLSVPLTLFVVLFAVFLLWVVRYIAGHSGRFFVQQQQTLGEVNGYIEEMINGQKVVKVFCHEQKAREAFDFHNDRLCEASTNANMMGNVIMPVVASWATCCMCCCGGRRRHGHYRGGQHRPGRGQHPDPGHYRLLPDHVPQLRQPDCPGQPAVQQRDHGAGGRIRIFELMDEPSEEDHGYVTLVNARYNQDGELEETEESTACGPGNIPITTAP